MSEWRDAFAVPPAADELVFLGWLDGERFLTATNDGFWNLYAECGYDWKPVWGKRPRE